jgi:hypothetical protein
MAMGRGVLATFVVGEKHGGPHPAHARGQFRHGQYNTAIAVAAIGVAAIAVAAITVARVSTAGERN